MISNKVVEQELKAIEGVSSAVVSGDGHHYDIIVVSNVFIGKSKIMRQRWVYAHLQHHITSGQLHAVNMTTWTEAEWEKHHG